MKTSICIAVLFGLLGLAIDPAFAAGGTQSVSTLLTSIQSNLSTWGVIVLTIAILFCGYKIAFTRATVMDCIPWLVGGILVACAGTIADIVINGSAG
ncbi:MAG: TrbC/VirB2 family protein [Burkholderiales bacterium]|nr:TrbC/VirB2 family protein [Burkholderiales bacterium]